LSYALSNALQALGLLSHLAVDDTQPKLPPEVAAARLDGAFRQTTLSRVHLCPLDLADNLPVLSFGPNCIRQITVAELDDLVDAPKLKLFNAGWTFDSERFSRFRWLVVKEILPLGNERFSRACLDFSQDLGRIEPHLERLPAAVGDALFAVLLAPWEDWSLADFEWRGFTIPWVYSMDDDLFGYPSSPLSPDTLSWVPEIYTGEDGDEIELARPLRFSLDEAGAGAAAWLNQEAWSYLTRARQSPLFETPIAHFIVRAFLADGIDEFLAHVTAIEAAMGLHIDHNAKGRKKCSGSKRVGATARVAARVAALLDGQADGEDYCKLFDARSTLVHGRAMDAIPSDKRRLARRLSRRVAYALTAAALAEPTPQSRESYLDQLLEHGERYLPLSGSKAASGIFPPFG
jgi:hypothetical protein